MTGIYILKSTYVKEDGFTVQTYEAWEKRKG